MSAWHSDRIWGEFEGEPPRKKRPGFLRETPGGRPKFDLGKSLKGPAGLTQVRREGAPPH